VTHLALVPESPLARGRLLTVADVRSLFPGEDRDKPTLWWVRSSFCPEGKIKMGRRVYWWETEALAWIDRQRGVR
jgi:membrane-bound lytic murein transglycosylase B